MTPVYYNFDSLTVTPEASKQQAIAATQTNPVTNIQYDNHPYFISTMYFYKDTTTNDFYFIVKTTSDPQSDANCIFFAIPLTTTGDQAASSTKTEIDKLFEASGPITINLSKCLTDGDSANIYTHTGSSWKTVVVKTKYLIKSALERNTVPTIDKLTLSGDSSEATIRKQIFGWNMDCTLLGEDSAGGELNVPTARIDTMDTMALLMIMLLVVSSFYFAVPIIYKYYIIPIAETHSSLPLASIDIFWTGVTVLTILSLTIYGIQSKQSSYYFFAFMVGLILFICKKWIREHIGNLYTNNLSELNVDFTAPAAGAPSRKINPGYFAVYMTSDGNFNVRAILASFFTVVSYIATNAAVPLMPDSSRYASAIISFLGFSLFTTSMFMDKLNWKLALFGIFIAVATMVPTILFNVLDLISGKIQK